MSLSSGLVAGERRVIKAVVKELAPGGNVDFDKLYQTCYSINFVVQKMGAPNVALMIFFIIEDCCEEFNVYQPMTKRQKLNLTEDIMDDLGMYTLEDMIVFFEGIKKQYYGEISSRLDAGIIWQMWDRYLAERNEHFYRKATEHSTNIMLEKRTGDLFLGKGRKESDTNFLNNVIKKLK